MAGADDPFTGRRLLRDDQAGTEHNLAARQSIWLYRQPRVDVFGWALGLAGLRGDERVLDIGCGNGFYLARLHTLGHRGLAAGLDISAGMLGAARTLVPRAALLAGDAADLPFPEAAFDVVLLMHVLYHVPDQRRALAQARRVLRPGGVLLAATNAAANLTELEDLLDIAVHRATGRPLSRPALRLSFTLDDGAELLRHVFGQVARHDQTGELVVPSAEPIVAYAASLPPTLLGITSDAAWQAVIREVDFAAREEIEASGAFRSTTRTGCFVCR